MSIDLQKIFKTGILNNDLFLIKNLFSNEGLFEIQDENLIDIEVGKIEFLEWLEKRFENTEITDVYFDECTSCERGKPVVIINGGYFPRLPTNNRAEYDKFGMVLIINDDKIVKTQFCSMFAKTPNCKRFELRLRKLSELEASGMSYKDAYIELYGEEGYKEVCLLNDENSDYKKILALHSTLVDSYEECDFDTCLMICDKIIQIHNNPDSVNLMPLVIEEVEYAKEIKLTIEDLSI